MTLANAVYNLSWKLAAVQRELANLAAAIETVRQQLAAEQPATWDARQLVEQEPPR